MASQDKFKKVDKEYVLSDSSVNEYGFRLLTEGYQLDEYGKNPIGYYMHDRSNGVVLKWDDLRVDGDKVMGKPVINLSNPRGQQTLDEAENGFLNAASVGHIVVLEYSTDPTMMLAGQTGPTITKWFNKECSLVDIPGNQNALCELYDEDDNVINLADFNKKSQIPNMKQIVLSAASLAALSLTGEPEGSAIDASIKDLAAKAEKYDNLKADHIKLQSKIDTMESQAVKDKVKNLLDAALTAKKITVEMQTELSAQYAENPEGLDRLLTAMKPQVLVTENLQAAAQNVEAKRKQFADLSWDEMDRKDGMLLECKRKFPELYAEKYEEKFNKPWAE